MVELAVGLIASLVVVTGMLVGNRIRILGPTLPRLFIIMPPFRLTSLLRQAMGNPKVFFDIAADGAELGRIVMEVGHSLG